MLLHQIPYISLHLPLLLLLSIMLSGTLAKDFYLEIQDIANFNPGSSQEDTCKADSNDGLQCMCIADEELTVNNSIPNACYLNKVPQLGFCREALCSLGYNVVTNETEGSNMTVTFDNTTLMWKIENLEAHLDIFMSVLQRTLVGVFLKSETQRESCLMAYKQWLCTTKLPLYRYSMVNDCECAESISPRRVRPCLNVCHKVLQHCPYYIPSKFQPPLPDRKLRLPPDSKCNATRQSEMYEIIYGGYPAFDCPAESILEKYQDFCQEKQTDHCQEKCRESSYSTCKCSCISMRSGTVSSFTVLPLNFVLLFLACVAHNIILVL